MMDGFSFRSGVQLLLRGERQSWKVLQCVLAGRWWTDDCAAGKVFGKR